MKSSRALLRCLWVVTACCLMQAVWAVQPEQGFGVGGLARIAIGHGADPANAVAAQRDGRIVALATISGQPALVRLQVDGSLDSGFGAAGKVLVDTVAPYPGSQSMFVDGADRILIAGVGAQNSGGSFAVSRYLRDGSRDVGFGDGGTAVIAASGQIQGGRVLLGLDTQGRIVLVGACAPSVFSPAAPCLVRLQADGKPDADFNNNSVAGPGDAAFLLNVQALSIDIENRVIIGGGAFHDAPLLVLRRFMSDGRADRSYDQASRAAIEAAGIHFYIAAALTDGRNRVVLAGVRMENATNTYGNPFALRLREDGMLDADFGDKGSSTLTPLSATVSYSDLQMQVVQASDGGLFFTRRYNARQASLQVLRLNGDGRVDGRFGSQGLASASLAGVGTTRTLAVDGQARVVVAGDDGERFAMARFTLSGQADTLFAGGGVAHPPLSVGESIASAVVRDSAGRTVLAGWSGSALAVARLLPDGRLDPAFAEFGEKIVDTVKMPAQALLIDGLGRYVVVSTDSQRNTYHINRLLADGSLDAGFSGGTIEAAFPSLPSTAAYNVYPSSWVNSALLDAQGRLVVAGTSINTQSAIYAPGTGGAAIVTSANRFSIARFLADGQADPKFGIAGRNSMDVGGGDVYANGAVLDQAGRIVLVGHAYNAQSGVIVTRWLDDGTPDPSWGDGGKVNIAAAAGSIQQWCQCVAIDHRGRVVLALTESYPSFRTWIARLNLDGSLDASFGTQGVAIAEPGDIKTLLLDDQDRILLAGKRPRTGDFYSAYDWQVLRYSANGERDLSFNGRGEAVYAYAGLQGGAYAMTLTAQGGLLLAGSMSDGKHGDMAALSLIESDATLHVASPALQANGQTTPLQLAAGAPLTLAASLSPGSQIQQPALWWLWVESGGLTFWYNATRGWLQTATPIPAYTGPLQSLPGFTLFQGALPPGDYHMHFAVDTDLSVATPTAAAKNLDLTVH